MYTFILAVLEKELPSNHQLVLIHLSNCADKFGGHCFPSISLLAKRSGLSERSVIRSLDWLESNGFIQRAKRSNTSNTYFLLFDPIKVKSKKTY
jgi:hypothetical protein